MCGIAGCITFDPADSPLDIVHNMANAQRHRGPDGDGYFGIDNVAVSHRRLAILDLELGSQPMWNEDKTICVVFNGEIYNFKELSQHLIQRGHRLVTRSDTECLVHLYEEMGERFVTQLRGMFALAILDLTQKKLFLARDRIGKKPLYWYTDGRRFLFASELAALMAAGPDLDTSLDVDAIRLYFSLSYIPGPYSGYQRSHKLMPGTTLTQSFLGGSPTIRSYWDLRQIEPDQTLSEDVALERLDELVTDAVRMRLVADVPLGAFLSGGTDSSLIVATMQKLRRDPVQTYTIGFAEVSHNELPYARRVATYLGTNHHEEVVRPDVMKLMDRVLEHIDEPFADASALPTYCVSAMAKKGVTVALSGDGGDELFGGYHRYARQRWVEWATLLPSQMLRLPSFVPPTPFFQSALRKWTTLRYRAQLPFPDRYTHSLLFFPDETKKRSLLAADLVPNEFVFQHVRSLGITGGGMRDCQRIDALMYLPDDILTKVDRMSMANGLETRVPLLDHLLVEFAMSIPAELNYRGITLKSLLKQLLARKLPRRLVYRRKMGFAVPLADWLRGPLKNRITDELTGGLAVSGGVFHRQGVEELLTMHNTRRADVSGALWNLWVFERFLSRRITRATVRAGVL
ncbi:MAG: asparagine synthase (glutamine-hydrolyzing) [Myxococcales bacterium]|nr:asparagine synthase (glutamine-hydrolyzing) [Myxococcales bacterium]